MCACSAVKLLLARTRALHAKQAGAVPAGPEHTGSAPGQTHLLICKLMEAATEGEQLNPKTTACRAQLCAKQIQPMMAICMC